jgi:putative Holliday junction resolvase
MPKILALDIGDRKIGLAITDTDAPIPLPKGVISSDNRDEKITRIREIIALEDIRLLVVGIPYNLKGEIAHQAEKVMTFIKHLKKQINIEIVTVDERLTSKIAGGGDDDESAAQLILETWIQLNLKPGSNSQL